MRTGTRSSLRIGLVACTKKKLHRPAPAQELYTSPLFKAAKAYAETHYDLWYILSAKHGVVEPTQMLDPYEKTLAAFSTRQRWEWGRVVAEDLRRRHHTLPYDPARLQWYLHAGVLYRHPLENYLPGYVEAPLSGLAIGEQLHWYRVRALADGHEAA